MFFMSCFSPRHSVSLTCDLLMVRTFLCRNVEVLIYVFDIESHERQKVQ